MIYDPQLAQSFMIARVLREERDRIVAKLQQTANLQTQIQHLQKELHLKTQKLYSIRYKRQESLQSHREQYAYVSNNKQLQQQSASSGILILRKNLSKIRVLKSELQKQKAQNYDLNASTQNLQAKQIQINQRIMKNKQNQIQLECIRKRIMIELQMSLQRASNIKKVNYEKKMQMASKKSQYSLINTNIQNLMKVIKQVQANISTAQLQLYEMKIQIYKLEEQKQNKYLTRQNLKAKSQLRQDKILEQQRIKIVQQAQLYQEKLLDKQKESKILNSKLAQLKVQSDMKQRDNRFKTHKVQCIKMLNKRLNTCYEKIRSFILKQKTQHENNRKFLIKSRDSLKNIEYMNSDNPSSNKLAFSRSINHIKQNYS